MFARTFDFSIYLYCAAIYLAMTETIRRVWGAAERALSRHKLVERSAPEAMQVAGATGRPQTVTPASVVISQAR